MKSFQFKLFDYWGTVVVETKTTRYTYNMDGAHVRVAERMARHTPGKALNYVKRVCTQEPLKENTMAEPRTEAGQVVRRQRAVAKREEYMRTHGNFALFKSDKGAYRVFPAPCGSCDRHRISGLLFYKWVKRQTNYKKFDRLIIHTVCYKCGEKSKMLILDPADYRKTENNPLWDKFKIRYHYLR
jgi:hypothetical protein